MVDQLVNKRTEAIPYVSFVVDDAGSGRKLNDDINAIVRDGSEHKYRSVLVGWQCGFEPMYISVHSYLDVQMSVEEAVELATDFLTENYWFPKGKDKTHDFIIE